MSAARKEKLIDKKELSELTGISARQIDIMKDKGEIPYYKIGRNVRFYPSEVFQFIEKRRVGEKRNLKGGKV